MLLGFLAVSFRLEKNVEVVMLFRKKQVNNCDYIVFDLETTGLNIKTDEIIEIAAIKVINTEIVDTFSVLVKPQRELKEAAQKVNRITQADLASALQPHIAMSCFSEFIGNNKLVGYNSSSFDLPMLKKHSVALNNPAEDALYLAKRKIPNLINYKLEKVSAFLRVPYSSAHRALADCFILKECYEKLLQMPEVATNQKQKTRQFRVEHTAETIALQNLQAIVAGIVYDGILTKDEFVFLTEWLSNNQWLEGNYPFDMIFRTIKQILADGIIDAQEKEFLISLLSKFSTTESFWKTDLKERINFEGKNFVLTGDFDSGDKASVKEYIECRGGICKSSVSSKTNYLIVGGQGSADWSFGNFGTKIKRAKELNAKGNKIVIIAESEFFENS